MITMNELVGALTSSITILIGFVFFYWVWQQYVIDSTRQQLFELRDELFDLATERGLDRDCAAYKWLREMLNISIRFAHDLDFVRILIMIATIKAVHVKNVAIFAKRSPNEPMLTARTGSPGER